MTLAGLLATTIGALEAEGIPYMLTGSLASSYHGEPRATRDIDLVIDPLPAALERLVEHLHRLDLYVDIDAARTALRDRGQFNAIGQDAKVDFVLRKAGAFSRAEFERRRRVALPGLEAFIVSVEDLILTKLVWALETGSDRHRRDAEMMIASAGGALDRAYLESWVGALGIENLWGRLAAGDDG